MDANRYGVLVQRAGTPRRSEETILRLDLAISPRSFAEQLAREIAAGGLTVVDIIERLIGEHLEDSVNNALSDHIIKAPRAIVHDHYYTNRFENLANLRQQGYATWYPEVRFATGKSYVPKVSEIEASGFDLGYIRYGGGIERQFRYATKELKTQVNHTVRLNKLTIPGETFSCASLLIERSNELVQPYIANLTAGLDQIEGFSVVSFDHIVSGIRTFCSCHSAAHSAMLLEAKRRAPSFAQNSWPHQVISLLESGLYSDGLCHFCVAESFGEDAASDWYGSQIQEHYEPYVDLLVRRAGMDRRTARAEARRQLSISRWIREDELYRLVARLFPAHTIRREASPHWLGQQRIDIYLPDLKLAIEHQGEQHYRPIGAFGGEEAFARVQELDERKRALCREQGVSVVDIRFDAPLTLPSLRSRLQRWLAQ